MVWMFRVDVVVVQWKPSHPLSPLLLGLQLGSGQFTEISPMKTLLPSKFRGGQYMGWCDGLFVSVGERERECMCVCVCEGKLGF